MTSLVERHHRAFADVGADLFASGAVSSHGGNLSVREGERILITRRGAMLGRLGTDDLVECGIEAGPEDERASRELVVHRDIYRHTQHAAVCHAHPVHTIARSLAHDVISPVDSESRLVVGDVAVHAFEHTIGSEEVARVCGECLRGSPVLVVRGHGPFAAAGTLEEAFQAVSVLEVACRILDLVESRGSER